MKRLFLIWNKIRKEPDIWFFYGFLLTFTLTIRKVIYFFPINNQFNEYTGIYLYLSDILLMLTILFWIITILRHNFTFLSMFNTLSFFANFKSYSFILIAPLIMILYSLLSTLWSINIALAFFKTFKLIEFYLLFLYIAFRIVPRETFLKNTIPFKKIFIIIFAVSIFHSMVAIGQFIFQKSLGLHFVGESNIANYLPGVAKLQFGSKKILRSYGLFPHPNILGGFLLFSIMLSLYLIKKLANFKSDIVSQCSAWNNLILKYLVPHGTFLLRLGLLIQSFALVLCFSKSAFLGLFVSLSTLFIYLHITENKAGNKNCGRLMLDLSKKLFHVEQLRIVFLFFLCLMVFVFLTSQKWLVLISQSLSERSFYMNVSRETITNHFFGVGAGQYIPNMAIAYPNIETWLYQPVHNIFLLIWSELGIGILVIFVYFLCKMFHMEQNKQKNNCSTPARRIGGWNIVEFETYLKSILAGFIVIMLFDHYFWDIQQGCLLLWIVFGLLAGTKKFHVEQNN
jgi:hypothetical protein